MVFHMGTHTLIRPRGQHRALIHQPIRFILIGLPPDLMRFGPSFFSDLAKIHVPVRLKLKALPRLAFSRPPSEARPHCESSFSMQICCPLSGCCLQASVPYVHEVTLSIHAVLGLPLFFSPKLKASSSSSSSYICPQYKQ